MKVYNGANMILGRLATAVAKDVLLGEEVKVVNCENIIISGKAVNTYKSEKQRRDRKGYPLKSAKLPRVPELFVRRSIRGMLPWKQARGKEAFKRVLCYRGIPPEFEKENLIEVKGAGVTKLPSLQYTTVGDICKHLGGKK